MQSIPTIYTKLVLVCTNDRDNGEKCCAGGGSEDIRAELKARVKALGLPVRVSKAGCMGRCATGPTVVIMPDDLWFGGVSMSDIDTIIALLSNH